MQKASKSPIKYLINLAYCLSALSCLLFISFTASAETVEARLPAGIVATANFHNGLASRPAVLLLHGFLQTYHSPPMSSLANNLASKGYTILSPTMSLNVDRRNQSMACEAIHTHTMEGEVGEVNYWVNWLNTKGFKEVVVVGFSSTGNVAALLAGNKNSNPSVSNIILTSIIPVAIEPKERQQYLRTMDSNQTKNNKKMGNFSVGYCKKNFTAAIGSYLSYASYDNNKTLELIRETSIPANIILGSVDTVMPANWTTKMEALHTKHKITILKNANHFFDDSSEFDFAEAVENILKDIPSKNL